MKKKFELSSGNVFADLGVPRPENALDKAMLAGQIRSLRKAKKLSQVQTALALGIDKSKIVAIESGRLSGFSLKKLSSFKHELDRF
jgi:predicted XRE-type DNA-binding protein